MRSCRPPPSIGCPTTTRCSRIWPAVLRPGGWLVAQCGGYGNIESVKRALATIGDGWLGPAHYETPMATVRRLDAAGFVDIECWLTDEPTRFEPGEPLETFMRTVILAPNLERLPPEEHAAFVHEVASRLPEPLIDYVRLNIVARTLSSRCSAQGRTRNDGPWPGITTSAAARTRARPRSIAAWSSPSGSISGVRSACHHRWVIA